MIVKGHLYPCSIHRLTQTALRGTFSQSNTLTAKTLSAGHSQTGKSKYSVKTAGSQSYPEQYHNPTVSGKHQRTNTCAILGNQTFHLLALDCKHNKWTVYQQRYHTSRTELSSNSVHPDECVDSSGSGGIMPAEGSTRKRTGSSSRYEVGIYRHSVVSGRKNACLSVSNWARQTQR